MAFDDELRRAVDTFSERLLGGHRQAVDEAVAAAIAVHADSRVVDLSGGPRLVEAVRAMDAAGTLTDILGALVSAAAREASRVGVLLVRGDTCYGWRFAGFGPAFAGTSDPQTIEVARGAGGVITDAVRSREPRSSDTAAPHFAELPPGDESVAVPLVMGGQIIAVLYADHGVSESWTDTLEVLARHAARCLEALTATTTARAFTERPEPPETRVNDPDPAGEAVAQRYARLLVSEIKLYHEAAVVAGIHEGDLMTRLGGEIAHARSLYDQRVTPALRQRTDYFHAELVRTLANGDSALLNSKVKS